MGKRAWGSIVRRRRRDGSLYSGYWVRFRKADGGRTWRKAGRTIEEAEDFLSGEKARIVEERTSGFRRVSVRDFSVEYSPALRNRVGDSTFACRTIHLSFIAVHFGDRTMLDLTRDDVADYLEGLIAAGRRGGTVRNYHSTLCGLWDEAVRRRVARENVCRGIRLPKPQLLGDRYLELVDFERVVACAQAWLRPLLRVLWETGMRIGEAMALEWPDVAADCSRFTIRRSKTGKPREVLLTPLGVETLRGIRAARVVPLEGPDRVFAGIRYGPRLHYAWKHALDRAKLPSHWRLHDLRHSTATAMLRCGVDPASIGRLLGNSADQVLRRYGVHAPGGWAEHAIAALARARGQVAATAPSTTSAEPEGSAARPAVGG